jgi:hypothetical protein
MCAIIFYLLYSKLNFVELLFDFLLFGKDFENWLF